MKDINMNQQSLNKLIEAMQDVSRWECADRDANYTYMFTNTHTLRDKNTGCLFEVDIVYGDMFYYSHKLAINHQKVKEFVTKLANYKRNTKISELEKNYG